MSLHQAVRELDVTAPAIYHHFPGGKEELVVAAPNHRLEGVHRALVRGGSPGVHTPVIVGVA
ncbi:TetR family transcriptional regulator [Nocardiopsis sp. L17-MgMaSL7]|uniref:TetR family transcriptional regulator n=1 Tax=Nocardiopsis sp. L17-MgMaSL7 TaxID=1938893 RepID=UPI000D70C20C|nr:TetR family transcriptional regulator [Nocardiopsis sp. L17-MgMaSL7]PWV57621.1 TetR family transcriptional regulator [Nocardiopsis sp. L17-MgMaSL7]